MYDDNEAVCVALIDLELATGSFECVIRDFQNFQWGTDSKLTIITLGFLT